MSQRVILFPLSDNPLHFQGEAIRVADDISGGLERLASHSIYEPQYRWIQQILPFQPHSHFVLVDVGLNAGLFSRQMLIMAEKRCVRVFGYEPDFCNYGDAIYNLSAWRSRCTLRQHALGDCEASFPLFRDLDNCGNYSIYRSAMQDSRCDVATATMIPAEREARLWHRVGAPIFYKSDVQGFDETLATLIDFSVWKERIFAAVLELWRIDKPEVDRDLFAQILESYPNRRLLHSGLDVSVEDVFAFLSERDGMWDDLALWR